MTATSTTVTPFPHDQILKELSGEIAMAGEAKGLLKDPEIGRLFIGSER